MTLEKVSPGQRLRIPAAAYNAMVDAAEAHKKQQANQSVTKVPNNFALQYLEITDILENHLICVHVNPNGTISTVPVYVWKPPAFQGSVSAGSYIVGDRIVAAVTDVMGQIDPTDSTSERTVLVDVNVNGGGATSLVAVLPPIPTTGKQEVFWGNSSMITGGTGDNQIWCAYAGQTAWTPVQAYTTLSGVPV